MVIKPNNPTKGYSTMIKQASIFFLFFICFSSFGQQDVEEENKYADSLWSAWQNERQIDSLRLDALGEHTWLRIFTEPDSALYYGKIAYDYATTIQSKKHIAHAHKVLGTGLWVKGDYIASLEHFEKELVIEKALGDKEGEAATLNKFGIVYSDLGNGIKALEYLQKSLKIREEIGDDERTFYTLNTIGDLYYDQGNTTKAIDYFQRCLAISEKNSLTLNNIGKSYLKQEDYEEALNYFQRSLDRTMELEVSRNKAISLGYIGEIYKKKGNLSEALDYFTRSLELREKIGSLPLISATVIDLGELYLEQKAYSKSIAMCKRSYQMTSELNSIEQKRNACDCLYRGYKAIGNKVQALAYHEEMSVLNDSLKKDEIGKELQQMEFAKTMRLDSIVKANEARITQEKLKTQESKISLLNTKNRVKSQWIIFGSLAAILVMGLLYYRYKQRVKYKDLQNKLLNSEIEYKKKDLTNFAVNISNNQEWALSLAEKMEGLKNSTGRKRAKELEDLDNEIKNKIWVDKSADDFYTKIDALSSSFYHRLTTQFEGLTKTEIRLCSLIKLDLDTKQIAALQNINPSSVKMSRNRLRKKLNLSPQDDLNAFLRTF